jgi:thiol-disulfide isomerase/thioredoxin
MVKVMRKTNKRNKMSKRKTMRRKRKTRSNRKYKGGDNKETTIIMMWMEGCGHCIVLKDTWLSLKNELKDVTFIDMEARNLDQALLEKYKIESPRGFPTLVKIKNGIVGPEPPSRDINELRKWIKS